MAIPALGDTIIPALSFEVCCADGVSHAAVPTLEFSIRIKAQDEITIRSILLDTQIQIAARARDYAGEDDGGLEELFGTRERWGTTLRTLPWTRTTLVVPPFTDSTTAHLAVPCTYDLEVIASRYFAALRGGDIPLEFLFSGSVFFTAPGGALQTTRIGWDQDASYRMPVAVWRETMDRHFPHSAWLRLGRDALTRLGAYKARQALSSWEATIDALLSTAEEHGRLG